MEKNILNLIKNEFKLVIYDNKIYITNYNKLKLIDNSEINLITKNKNITITGSDFILKRLEKSECLIYGIIKNIAYRGNNE